MSVTFDNVSSATAAGVASIQVTHTASGANLYMLVAATGAFGINGSVYNGISMSSVAQVSDGFSTKMAVFELVNPATGAHTLSVAGASMRGIGAITYNGVSQAAPRAHMASATATGATNPAIACATTAGNMVFGVINSQSGTPNPGATSRFSVNSNVPLQGQDIIATGSPQTLSWSSSSAANFWMIAVDISATASGSGPTFVYCRNLLGVGT